MLSNGNVRSSLTTNVATFIKELVLRLPEGETVDFRAGGYVQLECPPHNVDFDNFDIGEEYKGDWERFGFFKYGSASEDTTIRAYSMANYPEEKGIVKFQHSNRNTASWQRRNTPGHYV